MLITISFPNILNVSVQSNPSATHTNPSGADIAYYIQTDATTLPQATGVGNIVIIGPVVSTTPTSITCDVNPNFNHALVEEKFIMFSKNNLANMSSLLGYFARLRFKNSSSKFGELFSVGVDFFESSK